jgi:hypothetical protein
MQPFKAQEQGFWNCGAHTTIGTSAAVQWYMGLEKKSKDKNFKKILQ